MNEIIGRNSMMQLKDFEQIHLSSILAMDRVSSLPKTLSFKSVNPSQNDFGLILNPDSKIFGRVETLRHTHTHMTQHNTFANDFCFNFRLRRHN